jgi:flagellin
MATGRLRRNTEERMSFRVNTNIMAMSALRNLNLTGFELGRSVNRLSTGMRITTAADDPAGLIASESFRAQISGLDQALRNNQDAINFSKTAEGAMDEINRLLNDARSLAVASANSGTLTDAQRQANQSQLTSIVQSITRIAQSTSFGKKKLLDGSAGTYASSTAGNKASGFSFTGVFNGAAVTTDSTITVAVTTSAERALITGTRTFAQPTVTVNAGTFTINGVSFTTTNTDTIQDVVARINNVSNQTGVVANWTSGQGVVLTTKDFGSNAKVQLIDANAILLSSAGQLSDSGVNAVANVAITDSSGAVVTVTFDKGSGLLLRDKDGNSITLTEDGNDDAGSNAWGRLVVGTSTFQIGGNAGETTSLSLGNMAATELGRNAVGSLSLATLDLTTSTGATDAIKVIDKAIVDVTEARGRVGSFTRNTLESNVRSLAVARENLAATESSIRDIDIAAEMTVFTKLQILQQSGIAVLAQANAAPQAVLALLR